jgi:HAD superfamily phosphatase
VVKGILFDMDGVLLDVSQSYRLAIQKTAEHFLKKPVKLASIEEYKLMGGYNNDWQLTEAIIHSHGMKIHRDEIIDMFQHFYLGNHFDGLIQNEQWLMDKEILLWLSERYLLGIVTGRPTSEAIFSLNRFDVQTYFQVLIAMEDIPEGRGKPDPYGLNTAMNKLGTREAVYLGDNIDDICAAVSAGIVPVGVVPPGINHSRDLLKLFEEYGAHYILTSVNDIKEVLL